MIKDKPSKISIGNINVNGSNVFIPIQSPQSSFNIDAFTVEDLKSITDILKNTPEDVYIKAGKDKSVFIKVIKDLGKNIKEGALREVGKKLLEIGLFDLVPYLPLLQNILK